MPKFAFWMPGGLGHVAELAAAFVVEQTVAFERGDVDVVAAVVVVVADGHAHAVHLDVQAAAGGDVGERAVLIVAVERAEGLAAARRPVLAVDQQDVGPAVAIGIEERAARAQRLRQKLLPGPAAVVREVDAGLRGDVGELARRCGAGSCGDHRHRKTEHIGHGLPAGVDRRRGLWRRSGDALVIVNLLPLVVVLRADQARGFAVMDCEDSSALKRRNSNSSRAAFSRSPSPR